MAVEALVCNLIAAYQIGSTALLHIPLANDVLRGTPRYRSPVYGVHFRNLIALLESLGLIRFVTKGYNVRKWRRREITTIRPTTALRKAFPALVTEKPGSLTQVDPAETVVLKDQSGRLVAYPETHSTRRWRVEMRAINASLRNASISLAGRNRVIDDDGFAARLNARTLRRIWNNGDWEQGGRLYDGFWQTMRREERLPAIRLNNTRVANVDFCQFNLRLAYALAKVTPPRGDLYDVSGTDSVRRDWKQLREGRKKLTNAMFNAKAPLRRWPGKTERERQAVASFFPAGITATDATEAIRAKHAAVAGYFERGYGLRFMRIESDILVAVLLDLIKRGITALPLHDAVLVQERNAKTAKRTMEREAKRRIGTVIPAQITMALC
ncbi:hypothetical protein [Pseudolabrys sp. FHR47]|uniref:hypothetical protein n=1 Tax=Pseudolabrys sp. FHR47 TaxID=2562284 RepID=UPI0010BF239B|nr:hypothetical protein [Pseudolabrys sp. FHR47]